MPFMITSASNFGLVTGHKNQNLMKSNFERPNG
jgi:hypothetical protein